MKPPDPAENVRSDWHKMPVEETLKSLGATLDGLTTDEAKERLARYGPNELTASKKRGPARIFLAQFTDFMILVLFGAAVVSLLLGDMKDAVVIGAILILNAIIGFIQEYRAERAMEALQAMGAPTATVLRDKKTVNVPASELVPGDRVLLESGRIVPADLRLTESAQLKINESVLTGESVPVDKIAGALEGAAASLGDRRNMAYKGTVVTYGRAVGVVAATGMKTEFGKIAASLQETAEVKTPLQRRLAAFGKRLSVAVFVVSGVVFLAGIFRGEAPLLMFMTAVSLAVAAIPEALPAVVTISLALGARKMAQKNALVRRLPAVETLGSVTVICTDKTGTLTMNRMRVERIEGAGGTREELLRAMALCSDAVRQDGKMSGDPTETALYEAALKEGVIKEDLEKTHPRVAEVPFDSNRKCMTTLHKTPDGRIISLTKGAAETVLRFCAGSPSPETADRLSAEGLRVLAFAQRRWDAVPADLKPENVEKDLDFLGFAGMMDPLREEASAAVLKCKKAGITPIMITGDHPCTAEAIASRLGMLENGEAVMTGEELAGIGRDELKSRAEKIRVYARVSPDEKLKIVTALQDRGELVAMTGDGVNDAPALKKADIGVAMGLSGTDVAKEASSMILLDDNFATIVRAVEEGRRIYDNMRRFIRYVVTTNCAEVVVIALAPLFGMPIPFLPIQILWINLLTDGLPGLALAMEPAEKNIMDRPPRRPQEGIFADGLGLHVLWVGLLMAAFTLGTQAWFIGQGSERWQSIVFAVLCFLQLAHVLAIRSETEPFFRLGIFSNKPLVFAVGVTFVLQLGSLYVPFLSGIFKTVPLTAGELLLALGLSAILFFCVEAEKLIRNRIRRGRAE